MGVFSGVSILLRDYVSTSTMMCGEHVLTSHVMCGEHVSIVYTGHNVEFTVSKSQITVKSQCKMLINVGQTFKLYKLKGVCSQNFDLLSQL